MMLLGSITALPAQSLQRYSLTLNSNVGIGNLANNSKPERTSYIFEPSGAAFAHNVALLWGYHFSDKFSLHTGAGWAMYGVNGESAPFAPQNMRIWNFEVPLAFRIRKPINDWAPYVQVGMAYSLHITSKDGVTDYTGDYFDAMTDMFLPNVANNIAADIAAGVEYSITDRTNIFVGAEYRRLLISYVGFYSPNRYLWSAGLNLGCRVHLGK